jgi:hypothetical protein
MLNGKIDIEQLPQLPSHFGLACGLGVRQERFTYGRVDDRLEHRFLVSEV